LPQAWLYITFYVLQIKIISLGRNKYPRKRSKNAKISEFFPSAALIRISHSGFEFSIFYIAHSAISGNIRVNFRRVKFDKFSRDHICSRIYVKLLFRNARYSCVLVRKRGAHCGNFRGASACLNEIARYRLIIYLNARSDGNTCGAALTKEIRPP